MWQLEDPSKRESSAQVDVYTEEAVRSSERDDWSLLRSALISQIVSGCIVARIGFSG